MFVNFIFVFGATENLTDDLLSYQFNKLYPLVIYKLLLNERDFASGFYLNNFDALATAIYEAMESSEPILLIGVAFGLLDFAQSHTLKMPSDTIVMETGGMKGRRKEMIREEVHEELQTAFSLSAIHSEYGMTELLSQAYSKGQGVFKCPPWMRVYARETTDPLGIAPAGRSGGLNIIDLANLHSCTFIATEDLGRVFADGSFQPLGRFDHSEVRGCNLMVL